MNNSAGAAHRGGRRRRPLVAAEQAERERRRQQRRAAAREREQRIDAAEKDFYAAGDTIAAIEIELREQLTDLEARGQRLREEAALRIRAQCSAQQRAVVRLREDGCGVTEIAMLFDIPTARVRSILAEERRRDTSESPQIVAAEDPRAAMRVRRAAGLDHPEEKPMPTGPAGSTEAIAPGGDVVGHIPPSRTVVPRSAGAG
ncbi:hypothetical protein IU444_28015 [Nocardia farcinica]|uniref:hypothetical protein n=1 Tax=Nocardia TaxID=1817 RepID=UPI000FD93960|nr:MULTISPECIES: hypothetical protein [Nocardia]MBF6314065.1 hypothetical protein [Nocardia farcinica]MBF6387977.1 hypothetical protein [Nocardia farcinica]UEX20769.1 hypothetical protein LMJ57_17215 [Nocardia farcinica]